MSWLIRTPNILQRLGHKSNHQVRLYRQRKQEQDTCLKVGVVGSGSIGDSANLAVRGRHSVYLFNCGDGTFRLMSSRGHRFRYINNVFCTRTDWFAVGGIPSLARSIWDKNSLFPTFHGPPAIESYLERFAILTDLTPEGALNGKQFNREQFYDDGSLSVDFINLFPATKSSNLNSHVMAFVCAVKPRSGKLDLGKFTEMNLPTEYLLQLDKGKSVTTADGRIITPDELSSVSFKGGYFLVLDLPNKDYLHNLESNELLLAHVEEINSTLGFDFITHFSPPDVIATPEYQKFMRSVNTVKHFAINESNFHWSNKWMHKLQNELNAIDAEIFPKLCSTYDPSPHTYLSSVITKPAPGETVPMEGTSSGTKFIYQFFPKKSYSKEAQDVDDEDSDGETSDDEINLVDNQKKNSNRQNEYPRFVFFGTGSSFPGVLKNATSILLHTGPDTAILLDCGEGTAGQIIRFYGEQSENIFRKIKAVFISHMHGDHHVGFMELLRMREKVMVGHDLPPLLVLAPMEPFGDLLDFYEKHFGNVLRHCNCIENNDLIAGELSDEQKAQLNITGLKICRVPHTDSSFAISVQSKQLPTDQNPDADFKLTFSGDTVPCDDLVELGKNSRVLIHEATLEDSLTNSARSKMHSTISQAIQQGQKMQADYTILTHFSQRYRTLPPIPDELMNNKISIALDNMEIVPSDLPKLNDVYYKLKEEFKDEVGRVERRSKRYKEIDDMRN